MNGLQLKSWFTAAFAFFLLIAFGGFIIRYLPFQNYIDQSAYYNVLQFHSHTSFLAWVLPALMIFILHNFKIELFEKKSSTNIFFFFFYLTAFISGFSFIISGYSIFSIIILIVLLLISYVGLMKLYFCLNLKYSDYFSTFSIKTGIIFYFVSSLSTWVLPVLILTGMKKTPFYYYNIYFYLHFLFNGFITFFILSLFFDQTVKFKKEVRSKTFKKLLIIFATGTIFTYSGSLLWNKVHYIFNVFNITGSIMMLISLIYFSSLTKIYLRRAGIAERSFFIIAWISFFIKVILQTIQSFPYFAEASYLLKSQFIVGYMHLVTLGFISAFLLSYAFRKGILKTNFFNTISSLVFILSLILSEIVLFSHGTLMLFGIYSIGPHFNSLMLIFSIPLCLAIAFLFYGLIKTRVPKM
ncbi:MAG: hypothetical protein ACM3PT_06590 [Deltaproteobacteria bacterium]